jgi:hypothetical protein
MPARTIDVHVHVPFPKMMGRCGVAGPAMGVRDDLAFAAREPRVRGTDRAHPDRLEQAAE